MVFDTLLRAFLAPLAVAVLALLILWRPWRSVVLPRPGEWRGALAVGAAYLTGYLDTQPAPEFPPAEALERLFYVACAAIAYAVLDAPRTIPASARTPARLIFLACLIGLILRPLMRTGGWERHQSAGWVLGLTCAGMLVWSLLEQVARKDGPVVGPMIFFLLATATAVVIVISCRIERLGRITIALAAGILPYLIFGFTQRPVRLDRSGVSLFALILIGVWVSGHFFGESSNASLWCLPFAPAAAVLAHVGPLGRRAVWQQQLAALILAAVPIVLALSLAIADYNASAYGL